MPAKTKSKARAKAPAVNVVLSTFDRNPTRPDYRRLREGPIGGFVPVSGAEYLPSGGTPLLDACASFIGDLDAVRDDGAVTVGLLADESGSMSGNRLEVIAGLNEFVEGLREVPADPAAAGKVLAVVATDGFENASREMTLETLRTMFAEREADGWTFIFLGADQDAWDSARTLGLSGGVTGQSISSTNTPRGTAAAFRGLRSRGVNYVGEHDQYMAAAALSSNVAMDEEGRETVRTDAPDPDPEPVKAKPYGDVSSALEKAARSTRGS